MVQNKSVLTLTGDEQKIDEIKTYIDTYGVATEDIINLVHSYIFSSKE